MTERVPRHQIVGGLAAVGVILFSGCASASSQEVMSPIPDSDADSASLAAMLDPCSTPNLTTVEPGAITFATSGVPAPPFFATDDPSDREGFDADLSYVLAEILGFRPGQVTWELVPVAQILSGEFVDYDVALGDYQPLEDDASPVVYSQPYLDDRSFALVRGNPLLVCVDRAIDEMSEVGTLDELRVRWISSGIAEGNPAVSD